MSTITEEQIPQLKSLYYSDGCSMQSVAGKFGVSIHAVEHAMRKFGLKRRSSSESNNLNYLKQRSSYIRQRPISSNDKLLEVAGLMLYWAEGGKSEKSKRVDFANSDPKMIIVFLKFLRKSFLIDESKLRIYLYCYSNQNISELVNYWSTLCNIPIGQFSKPYIRNDFNPEQVRIMEHGLIHVRYSDKKLLSELKKLIHYYSDSL